MTLAVGENHHDGNFSDDDFSSGIWRPTGAGSSFFEYADTGPLYIGPGLQHSNWRGVCQYGFESAGDYSVAVLSMIDAGDITSGLYTSTIAVPQSAVNADPDDPEGRFQVALGFIDEVNMVRETDERVKWSTYTQVATYWEAQKNGTPLRLDFSQIPSDLYTCSPR